MRFTEDSLRKLGRSDRKIGQLASRKRGGETGTSGYEYQRRFAILRVLELAAAKMDGEVHVEGLCPVDDVVVESNGHHEHSQVKESPAETWGKKGGKLQKEFRAQAALLRDAKMQRASSRREPAQVDRRGASWCGARWEESSLKETASAEPMGLGPWRARHERWVPLRLARGGDGSTAGRVHG